MMNIKGITAMTAGLALCAGLAAGTACTANAADVEYRAGLPTRIVNSGFDYPKIGDSWWGNYGGSKKYITINPNCSAAGWAGINDCAFPIGGWDADAFGWKSTQKRTGIYYPNVVELNRGSDGNVYAEITADVQGTAIYQDVATTPGAVYTWRLKHASASNRHVDSMRVMIGAPGRESAQQATRVVSESGRPLGDVGTLIATPAKSSRYDEKTWDTYEGTYTIPAGQTTTRFTFQAVDGAGDAFSGNNVDMIEFEISYPLTYELNGGSGTVPNRR